MKHIFLLCLLPLRTQTSTDKESYPMSSYYSANTDFILISLNNHNILE